MKLISLNIERYRHLKAVFSFIDTQKPDVLCLQECPEDQVSEFKDRGYHVTYAPLAQIEQDGRKCIDGVLLGSLLPHEATTHFYFQNDPPTQFEQYDHVRDRQNTDRAIIVATVNDSTPLNVATTHFTWTPEGNRPNRGQIEDMEALLQFTSTLPPHILCGDFNIPRHHNHLYNELIKHYTDNIPKQYTSSMDKNLHRFGTDPSRAVLFESYMVDYLFTQSPYTITNVELVFDISDHAAVLAEVTI